MGKLKGTPTERRNSRYHYIITYLQEGHSAQEAAQQFYISTTLAYMLIRSNNIASVKEKKMLERQKRDKAIITYIKEGHSRKEAAQAFEVRYNIIKTAMYISKEPCKREKVQSKKTQEILMLLRTGKSQSVISETFGVSRQYVSFLAKKHHIEYINKQRKVNTFKEQQPVYCTICNTLFTPVVKTQTTCGEECRKEYQKEYQRRYLSQKQKLIKEEKHEELYNSITI